MITKEEIQEIRQMLEESQNPLFFFDNDADGLCSFLLLQRYLGRGKGVAIKSFPDLDKSYLRKIDELNPDYVFILDKPRVNADFLKGVIEKGIPLVWIDHHQVQHENLPEEIKYYNSVPSAEPVTYICQKITRRKEDEWIAMIGCISDVFIPDFAEKFSKENPEIYNSKENPFDSLHGSQIGKAAMILNFGLKDSTTNVVKMLKFLIKANSIQDILQEGKENREMHKRYNQLTAILEDIRKKAEKEYNKKKKLLFFTYQSDISMSAEVSNALIYEHKDSYIFLGIKKEGKVKFSARGKKVRDIVLKAIKDIEGATGGGHEDACGIQFPEDKLEEFKKKIEELI
jgi:single-stranded DNA-specific DHH superfamily exonuclease